MTSSAEIGTTAACCHCGERIILVNLAFGPTWRHQTSGAAFMDGMHQFCHTTAAAPEAPTRVDQTIAAREEADRQWRALVDPLQEAVFEFDVCEPCEAPTVWRRVLRAARPVRRALAADIRKGDGDE